MDTLNFFRESLVAYWNIFWVYLPLGIIGIWRWGVWFLRKIISFFYQMPKGNFRGTLSVITPVYNEDPDLFQRALDSWRDNGVDEIVAVIDYTDKSSIEIFEKFKGTFSGAKMIITEKPGKRPALVDGIRVSTGEIVALVDSDTVWSPKIKNNILGPFSDLTVGGLVTRQDVFETDTLARKLFKILLDDRYLLEYPFLSTVSDTLLCLSGRTAVYRREAIFDKLDGLLNDSFWGKPMISGDDKTLTRLVQMDGWKTRYLRDVRVYTSGAPKLFDFMKQKLRWTRNGLRSDSKVLFSKWIWKENKWLAFHMLDKFVSPLTLLLGMVYFLAALYFGHWGIAAVIVAWWMASRSIKLYPHLKEKPWDVFILPSYIFMTFVMAVVKLYALITIDEQGWITRWDKDRLARLNILRKIPSYTATFTIIGGLFFGVVVYKENAMMFAETQKQKAQEVRNIQRAQASSIFTPEKSRLGQAEIEKTKADLIAENQNDPYGYYVVKPGDTVSILRKRYGLTPAGRILSAQTKNPISALTPLVAGQKLAVSIADLRNPISLNFLAPNFFVKPPRITYEAASNTIFVNQGGSVATLSKISQSLPLANRNLLEQVVPGEWILRANLYVGKNVTLVLDGSEVKYLKLKSDENFAWLRSESGNILISNTKITSWNEKENFPDVEYQSGRAYITAKNSGRMDIVNSELGYLGYAGLPKRGGEFGGSYGVSWKIKNQGFRDSLLTGVVSGSKFHHNYFGFYTYGTTGMLVQNNEAYENVEYGFDPHDDTNNMLMENNRAYRNGNHGIIFSRRCFDNSIIGNASFDNRLHGIMLDRSSNNNLVQANVVYGNVDGIALFESNGNLILENEIRNNVSGIRLNAGSANNYAEKNKIFSNARGLYLYSQAQKNLAVKNGIHGNETGVVIKGAFQNSLFDNFKQLENKKDGRITDGAYENNIQ